MKTVLLWMLSLLLGASVPSYCAPSASPLIPAASYVLGTVAKDRLHGMNEILLHSNLMVLWSSRGERINLTAAQERAVTACLSDLVLDDRLYVEEGQYSRDAKADTLVVAINGNAVRIAIRRDAPYLTLMALNGNGYVSANYQPVLAKVARLLQALFPGNFKSATFHPQIPPPSDTGEISTEVALQIAAIRPGMTRADLYPLFHTEGGAYTREARQYVYTGQTISIPDIMTGGANPSISRDIKIQVEFAPRGVEIVWMDGYGIVVHPDQLRQFDSNERPDDIILRVSSPYLQGMVLD